MKDNTTYQGWPNWATWNANLWLTSNDEHIYRRSAKIAEECSLTDFEQWGIGVCKTISDFTNDDLHDIDWGSIRAALLEG